MQSLAAIVILSPRLWASAAQPSEHSSLSPAQQLIVSSFNLDVEKIKSLLAKGVDVNARLGFYDRELFRDKWFLGYSPIGSDKWTAVMAVASSERAPAPGKKLRIQPRG